MKIHWKKLLLDELGPAWKMGFNYTSYHNYVSKNNKEVGMRAGQESKEFIVWDEKIGIELEEAAKRADVEIEVELR